MTTAIFVISRLLWVTLHTPFWGSSSTCTFNESQLLNANICYLHSFVVTCRAIQDAVSHCSFVGLVQ